jgi:hypothetical protein
VIVMGVDPGLLTGACLVEFGDDGACELRSAREIEFQEIESWCTAFLGMSDAVVAERFIINRQTIGKSQAPYSLEVIGAFRLMCYRYERSLQQQSAADAKSTVDNSALKGLGLWFKGGEGHANDAIRHAVLYALRTGWKPSEAYRESVAGAG